MKTAQVPLTNLTDEQLMARYVEGNYAAFEELYKRHAGKVNGFLRKRLQTKEMIEDVFQATFLQLHQSRRRYDSSLPFLPWLFTICRNVMIDKLRAQKRTLEDLSANAYDNLDPGVQIPNVAISASESAGFIDQWAQSLSQKERDILSLRFANDFSFDEIAKRLGINSSNARKVSQRALKKLKSIWK
jgi:RNA polymerase sigma-70 factor (ECF subfamily)